MLSAFEITPWILVRAFCVFICDFCVPFRAFCVKEKNINTEHTDAEHRMHRPETGIQPFPKGMAMFPDEPETFTDPRGTIAIVLERLTRLSSSVIFQMRNLTCRRLMFPSEM